jgi:hypothetical protein
LSVLLDSSQSLVPLAEPLHKAGVATVGHLVALLGLAEYDGLLRRVVEKLPVSKIQGALLRKGLREINARLSQE